MTLDDRATYQHKQWIDLFQSVDLVLEVMALVQAQTNLDLGQLVLTHKALNNLILTATDKQPMPENQDYQELWPVVSAPGSSLVQL